MCIRDRLYSPQTTFGETDFSALCVHLNKHVNKRSFLVLYTNFASIQVPAEAYYGVQTQRALNNYKISNTRMCDYPE